MTAHFGQDDTCQDKQKYKTNTQMNDYTCQDRYKYGTNTPLHVPRYIQIPKNTPADQLKYKYKRQENF